MDDITNALIGFQVGQWANQDEHDKAVRKWFDSLPKDTRERLIPLNPDVAAAVLRANAADIRVDLEPLLQEAHRRRQPHPEDGHRYDGWAHDSFCVQCRRPEHEHHLPRPPKPRPRAPLVMILALAITFVGLLVQFPGTCIVVVGRAMMSWAEGQEDE